MSNRSLALAASSNRSSYENRLTEIYAAVLEEHTGFANEILALADLPAVVRTRVWTQETVTAGGRIDLVLRGQTMDGAKVVLYSEHKEPGAGWQEGQPEKYLAGLRSETTRGGGRLMAVVGTSADARAREPMHRHERTRSELVTAAEEAREYAESERGRRPIVYRTWQQIAECAERAGAGFEPSDTGAWREAARQTCAPACQRILLELLWYLEQNGYALTTPITDAHLDIYDKYLELDAAIEAVLTEAATHLISDHFGKFRLTKAGSQRSDAQRFKATPPSWVERWGGEWWLEAGEGQQQSIGTPDLTFQAYVWLPKKRGLALEQRLDGLPHRLRLEVEDSAYLWSERTARELTGAPTVADQGKALAKWATAEFGTILNLKPGPVPRT